MKLEQFKASPSTPLHIKNFAKINLNKKNIFKTFDEDDIGKDLRCVIDKKNEIGLSKEQIHKLLGVEQCLFEDYLTLYKKYRASFILQKSEKYFPSIREIREALSEELSSNVEVTTFVTPSEAQALSAHYDAVDVLALQVSGCKVWNIYEPILEKPNHKMPHVEITERIKKNLKLHSKVIMNNGDALYVPRGWVHEVATESKSSIHVSFVIFRDTFLSVFTNMILNAQEKIYQNMDSREEVTIMDINSESSKRNLNKILDSFTKQIQDYIEDPNKKNYLDYVIENTKRRGIILSNKNTWTQVAAINSEQECLVVLSDIQYRYLGKDKNKKVKISTDNRNVYYVSKDMWYLLINEKKVTLEKMSEYLDLTADEIIVNLKILINDLGVCRIEKI